MTPHSKLTTSLLWIVIVTCFFLTAVGLKQLPWPNTIPWDPTAALVTISGLLLFTLLLTTLLSYYLRTSFLVISAALIGAIGLVSGNLSSLAFVSFFILSSIIVGESIINLFRLSNNRQQCTSTAFLIGSGTYATFIGIIAHFPVNYLSIYSILLATPLLVKHQRVFIIFHELTSWIIGYRKQKPNINLIGSAISAIAIIEFIVALLPELGGDALSSHLLIPSQLATSHIWGFNPYLYVMAVMPMLGEWLYSIGYMISGETGARLINLLFTYLLAYQGYTIALWLKSNKTGAQATALLLLSTPLTFLEISSAFIDAVWASYIVAAIFSLLHLTYNHHKDAPLFIKESGLLLGFAAATKAITLPILPIFTAIIFLKWRYLTSRPILFSLLVGLLLFTLVGTPAYLTAWLISKNPVFPFYNDIFKSPFFSTSKFDNPLFHIGTSWNILYKMVFSSGNYLEGQSGSPGFQWILLLPASVLLLITQHNKKALFLLIVTALLWVTIFHCQSYFRYVYPLFVLFSVIICTAIWPKQTLKNTTSAALKVIFLITILLNIIFLPAASWVYRSIPFKIFLDEKNKVDFLESALPIRLAIELTNQININHTPVAFFTKQSFGSGLNADALYSSWYNPAFSEGTNNIHNHQDLIDLLKRYNSNIILLDETWGNIETRTYIKDITKEIASFNQISVRQILDQFRFKKELLKNTNFASLDGWSVDSKVIINADKTISVFYGSAAISQIVAVNAKKEYLNKVTARCLNSPAAIHTQINWINAKNQPIGINIRVFDCNKEWETYQAIIIAPKNATTAVVSITSQTDLPVQIRNASLKSS